MILSDAEIYKRCEWRSIPTMQDVARIQHAETLRQLEKEGRLKKGHEEWRGLDFHGEWRCKPDCWLCAD